MPAVLDDRVDVPAALAVRIDGEPALLQGLQDLPLGVERGGLEVAHVVEEDRERAIGGDRRVLLPDGSGGGVARVREHGLAGLFELRVQPCERLSRHVDLTPHLEPPRRLERALQRGGDGLDGPEVLGDVLAHASVAAGGAAREPSALVEQGYPQPVDLRLAHVLEARAGQRARDARLELAEVVRADRVVQRQHGGEVLHGGEGLGATAARALGRAVGRDQLGMGLLQLNQLAVQPVVLGVGDLGPVQDMVEVVVPVDLLAQLVDPGGGVGRLGHGPFQDIIYETAC